MARQSGRLLNQISSAQIDGAGNLLRKAARHLAAGDTNRGEQLIQRTAQMPYDPREEGSPGVRAARMLVYLAITDQFEASPPNDMAWLDATLDVYPQLDPTGRADVASVVHGFVLQSALFTVTPAEKRRIQQAFGDAPLEADLGDLPNATAEQRHEIIRSLIMTANALSDAYVQAASALPDHS